MHLKAKRAAFGGLLLAMTVIFMFLGSVIETNTLFLLAAASFFVGVVFREFGQMTGLAFYLSAVFFWHRINSMLLLLPEWDFIFGEENLSGKSWSVLPE